MRTILVPTVASFLLLSAGAVGYAQEPPPQQPPTPQQQSRPQEQRDRSASPAKSVTLKGCLTKSAQQYMVADEASGEKVSFAAPDKLDSYLNQTVELKGQVVEQQGGAKTFQPESVKPVSASCAK